MNLEQYEYPYNNQALRQHQRASASWTEQELLERGVRSTPSRDLSPSPKAAVVVEEMFAATHPPRHSATSGVVGAVSKLPQLDREYSGESPGGTCASSVASSLGGGLAGLGLGLGAGLDIGQTGGVSDNEEGLSPLAPGSFSGNWTSPAQLAGFDKQTPARTAGTESLSPQDLWNDDDDDSYFPSEGAVRELVWDYLPGETSITLGVRLYLTHLDPFASHEENCALLLRQILERVAREELDVPVLKTRHIIKLEAFLRSVILSVPARTWQESVRGAFARTAPVGNSKSPGHGHQMCGTELTFRMSLFISMMKAERKGGRDADAAVDDMRVESVVRGYAANAAEILPLQRPARTLLPPLLFCLACDVLVVRLLAPEVREVCHKIVSDYGTRAKLWMSPPQNAERYLRPLVTEFLRWLRSNHDVLYQGSATEGLLCSIDDRLRNSLKHQVYRSPGHFLAVIKSLSEKLTDMPLPSYDPSGGDNGHPFDLAQTLKDVSRERFYVNKTPTDPADCWRRIRALLLKAATAENPLSGTTSSSATSSGATSSGTNASGTTASGATSNGTTSSGTTAGQSQSDLETETGSPPRPESATRTNCPSEDTSTRSETVDNPDSRGSEQGIAAVAPGDAAAGDAAGGGNGVSVGVGSGGGGGVTGKAWGVGSDKKGGVRGNDDVSKSELEIYVDQCAWRVLHAASRTASGGDCFFVVQDLFGGEGVLVKMAAAVTEPIKIRTEGLAARVTTVDKHDIYHTSDVDMSTSAPRPLMTITTTMKEVIQFKSFADTQSVNKSDLLPGGSTGASLDESEKKELSNVISDRFITISANLPRYPEDHLDASAGVLEAPLSTEQAPQAGCSDEANTPGEAAVLTKSDSTSSSNDTNQNTPTTPRPPAIEAALSLGRARPRPSTFRSPLPASPLRPSKLLGGLGKDTGVELNWQEESETCSKSG